MTTAYILDAVGCIVTPITFISLFGPENWLIWGYSPLDKVFYKKTFANWEFKFKPGKQNIKVRTNTLFYSKQKRHKMLSNGLQLSIFKTLDNISKMVQ